MPGWEPHLVWVVAGSLLLVWVVEGGVTEMEAVATAMYGKVNLGIPQLSCY